MIQTNRTGAAAKVTKPGKHLHVFHIAASNIISENKIGTQENPFDIKCIVTIVEFFQCCHWEVLIDKLRQWDDVSYMFIEF